MIQLTVENYNKGADKFINRCFFYIYQIEGEKITYIIGPDTHVVDVDEAISNLINNGYVAKLITNWS
jgi:hypothetical protein